MFNLVLYSAGALYALGLMIWKLGPIRAALIVLGVVLIFAIDEIPQLPTLLSRGWPLMSLAFGVVVMSFTPAVTDRAGSDGFYTTASEVIPVFLLAISVELKVFPKRRTQPRLLFLLMGIQVYGLFYALRSVERGYGGPDEFSYVCGALAAGAAAITLIAMSEDPPDEKAPEAEQASLDQFPHGYL